MSSEQIAVIIVSSIISFVVGYIGPGRVIERIRRALRRRKPSPALIDGSISASGPGCLVWRVPGGEPVKVGDTMYFQGRAAGRVVEVRPTVVITVGGEQDGTD